MKELWIHAGLFKSGSSALQVFFARNIQSLQKEGLNYLELTDISDAKTGKISSGNGFSLAQYMLPEEHSLHVKSNNGYNELLHIMKKTHYKKTILSSEFFTLATLNKMEQLKSDLFKIGVNLKVIFYVRRQDQFLMSYYMQQVKRNNLVNFPEDYLLDNYKKLEYLKYFTYTTGLVNILGKENLYPFIYENTKINEKGLVGHFLKTILGNIPKWVEPVKSVNTSPSPLEIKFLLACNQYSPNMKFSDILIEDSISRGKSQKYQDHRIVSDKIIDDIMQYFQDENEKFTIEFTEGVSFPDSKVTKYIDIKKLDFSVNDVVDIVSGYLVRLDNRLMDLEKKTCEGFLQKIKRNIKGLIGK